MKVSEIKVEDVKNYLNIYHDDDNQLIESILRGTKSYAKNYTGLSTESMDLYEELSIAIFVLSAEMYDNRTMTVDRLSKVNPLVESMLNLHSINLL
jgi:uncharacterized phage protein (predicted DNA packaging)